MRNVATKGETRYKNVLFLLFFINFLFFALV